MSLSTLFLVLAALIARAASSITPTQPAPLDCQTNYLGAFAITVVNISTASPGSQASPGGYGGSSASSGSLTACNSPSTLSLTLSGGILLDSQGRTGYIAANHQLQFDGSPQVNAIFTGGFSACADGSLALGAQKVFYSCVSGGFTNLFDTSLGSQCAPVEIAIERLINCG